VLTAIYNIQPRITHLDGVEGVTDDFAEGPRDDHGARVEEDLRVHGELAVRNATRKTPRRAVFHLAANQTQRIRALSNDASAVINDGGALSNDASALSNDGSALGNNGGALSNDGSALSNDGSALRNDGRS
jgi:hypothetical protein